MPENEYLHTPNELEKLIDYQTGLLVSKTIIKQSTGTITLLAFDKGEGLNRTQLL